MRIVYKHKVIGHIPFILVSNIFTNDVIEKIRAYPLNKFEVSLRLIRYENKT